MIHCTILLILSLMIGMLAGSPADILGPASVECHESTLGQAASRLGTP